MNAIFHDRRRAGAALAERLESYAQRPDSLVLGLGRGGVPVGYEIARALGLGFDIFLTRRLQVPWRAAVSMGVIAAGGVRVLDWATIAAYDIPQGIVEDVARREATELARREDAHRGGRPPPKITGRIVILASDGLAGGGDPGAAIDALRAYRPARIVVAMPFASFARADDLRRRADETVIIANEPDSSEPDDSTNALYEESPRISDREVRQLLASSASARARSGGHHPAARC